MSQYIITFPPDCDGTTSSEIVERNLLLFQSSRSISQVMYSV